MPPSQCNANKSISVLKELFSEHGIPETLRSYNGPYFANYMFAEFAKEWNFDHNTSSPRNPGSNGQVRCCQSWHIHHSRCSSSYTRVFAAGTISKATNSSCCTCCTSTITSCFCSNHKYSTQITTCHVHTTVTADAFHWRCTKADWHSTCCPSPISSCQ